jgi:peptidyl-tRNA hydrolase, PTH1 family
VPETLPRTVLCLGNPGPEYSATRHNVAWWLADRLAEAFGLGRFRQQGFAGVARGKLEGMSFQVVKPYTYMNRSGRVVDGLSRKEGFDLVRDLLVVVDETALDPGRVRFRPGGSAGGHNGLKSIEAALGTQEYARLRIGVGAPPPGFSRSDWVLSAPPRADRQIILDLMDSLVECVGLWATLGIEAAMSRCNN